MAIRLPGGVPPKQIGTGSNLPARTGGLTTTGKGTQNGNNVRVDITGGQKKLNNGNFVYEDAIIIDEYGNPVTSKAELEAQIARMEAERARMEAENIASVGAEKSAREAAEQRAAEAEQRAAEAEARLSNAGGGAENIRYGSQKDVANYIKTIAPYIGKGLKGAGDNKGPLIGLASFLIPGFLSNSVGRVSSELKNSTDQAANPGKKGDQQQQQPAQNKRDTVVVTFENRPEEGLVDKDTLNTKH